MMRIHTESGSEGIVDLNHQSRMSAYTAATRTFNVTNGYDQAIRFDTEDYDERSEFSTSAYEFTAKETGYYIVNFCLTINSKNFSQYAPVYVKIGDDGMNLGCVYGPCIARRIFRLNISTPRSIIWRPVIK